MLPWDTEFFGFRIARVLGDRLTPRLAQQLDTWCREQRIRCLYFLADASDEKISQVAQEAGFQLVDVRITFGRRLSPLIASQASGVGSAAVVRPVCIGDMAELQRIARESHRTTRFFHDANFPRSLSERLYETWIRVSCEGYADQVLVAEHEGVPVAYVTCHLEGGRRKGRIGLVAVHSQAQGKGIGQAMVRSALEWFGARDVEEVSIVTQERNREAQQLYERFGFCARDRKLWYHKWYEPMDGTSG